jgi:hypothetical protein
MAVKAVKLMLLAVIVLQAVHVTTLPQAELSRHQILLIYYFITQASLTGSSHPSPTKTPAAQVHHL